MITLSQIVILAKFLIINLYALNATLLFNILIKLILNVKVYVPKELFPMINKNNVKPVRKIAKNVILPKIAKIVLNHI